MDVCPKCKSSNSLTASPEKGLIEVYCRYCGYYDYIRPKSENTDKNLFKKPQKRPIGKYHLPCQCHKVLKTLPCGLWFQSQKSDAKYHPDHRAKAVRASQSGYFQKYYQKYMKGAT